MKKWGTTLGTASAACAAFFSPWQAAIAHAAGSEIHVVLKAEPIAYLGTFPITNSLILTAVASILLIVFAVVLRRKLALLPGRLQAGIEILFEAVLTYMENILENKPLARKFFPLIMTLFLFLLVANQLAFIPGVNSIFVYEGDYGIPLLRAPAADLNVGIALAIISFLVIEISGVVLLGLYKYSGRYLNFTSVANFFVGIIELISNLGRLISFSFRLFGNIFAGEVMIIVASFFLAFLLPLPLIAFEVFVGFIQAVVFSMLTLFFIKLSIMEPHGKEAH